MGLSVGNTYTLINGAFSIKGRVVREIQTGYSQSSYLLEEEVTGKTYDVQYDGQRLIIVLEVEELTTTWCED